MWIGFKHWLLYKKNTVVRRSDQRVKQSLDSFCGRPAKTLSVTVAFLRDDDDDEMPLNNEQNGRLTRSTRFFPRFVPVRTSHT